MYDFQFVRMVNGKSKTETFRSIQAAHSAMGVYAGKHNLNVKINEDRWRENARSILYKGDDPTFNTIGYVSQVGPSRHQPEPKGTTKIRKRKTDK
jgi:hypothetical protein